ncbi:MAG: antitoxin MazE5 [Dermatophilaceae bacterium]
MTRARVSTTVDAELLAGARRVHGTSTDSSLLEAALEALLRDHREAEIDVAYATAYGATTDTAVDERGDLGEFLDAARRR